MLIDDIEDSFTFRAEILKMSDEVYFNAVS
jgi:hypothetical protein